MCTYNFTKSNIESFSCINIFAKFLMKSIVIKLNLEFPQYFINRHTKYTVIFGMFSQAVFALLHLQTISTHLKFAH